MACSLATTTASFLQTPVASHSSTNDHHNNNSSSSNKNQNPKPRRHINGSPSLRHRHRRSLENSRRSLDQRAIGITEDPLGFDNNSSNSSAAPTSFLDLLSSTPIGQMESPAERKIREVAEWVVDQTESNARAGSIERQRKPNLNFHRYS